ncbi:MAG: NAD(P)-binding domain-containing protein [Acidobacteria bacterium]|nr:NAD(P)-binding domain-containing protein [Acidobacteriota bacterium]
MKSVGVIGSGVVGQTLARGFLTHGFDVMIGSRDPGNLARWVAETSGRGKAGTDEETASFGEIVVLAVKGLAAEEVVKRVGPARLAGKLVIDTTNPISDEPPRDGVLRFFTTLDESLMERLQRLAPEAHFVKAFNSVGNALMLNPSLPGGKPTMFICGNDDGAKKAVTGILDSFGWETADMGSIAAARAIEPLCMLWCIPGFLRNDWAHAFKLLAK